MNPGNGTETLIVAAKSFNTSEGRNQMNPGNGTETQPCPTSCDVIPVSQSNESRQRDWNPQRPALV